LLLLNKPRSIANMRMMKSKKPPKKRSSLLMLFVSFCCVSYKLFQTMPVGIFRQAGEDVKSLPLVSQHLGGSIFHPAVRLHEGNDLGYFFRIFAMIFNQVDDTPFFGVTNLFQCMYERQRQLFLLDVVAQRLTYIVDAEVEQIILDLEGNAYFLAEPMHLSNHVVVCIRRGRSTCAARGDQRRCLLPDYFEIDVFFNIHTPGFFDLQQL